MEEKFGSSMEKNKSSFISPGICLHERCSIFLQSSNRCSTSLSLGLSQSLLIEISPFFSICQLSMSIAELGKVKGSDLFSFLNLLLVRLDLGLQLINENLHALMVLPVFIRSISLSIIQPSLHVLDLALKQFAVSLISLSQFLFTPELISNAGSINHSFLGFVIRETSLRNHLIQITMEGLHLRFQLPLGSSNGLVGASLVRQLFIGVRKLLLSNTTSPIRLLKKSPGLLQSILSRVGPSLIGKQ